MSASHEVEGQTSDKNLLGTLPIQQPPESGAINPEINTSKLDLHLDIEKTVFPDSIIILRELHAQVAFFMYTAAKRTKTDIDAFTNRAILTKELYEAELLDETSPTGKDRARFSEILELAETYKSTSPLLVFSESLLSSAWVKKNPNKLRPLAVEAYAIACIITLDENNCVPAFMQVDE